jgi:alpha-N-acetylglucosamine transferase
MTFLNDMKLMKRQFRNAPRQKKGFVTNIIRNQEQLENLHNDIDNSIFNKEEINAIITRETQAYEALSTEIKEFQIAYPSYVARFDSLYNLTETFNYE